MGAKRHEHQTGLKTRPGGLRSLLWFHAGLHRQGQHLRTDCAGQPQQAAGSVLGLFQLYVIPDTGLRHDVEAFLLRTQPWYLRGLNRQGAKFADAKKVEQQDEKADAIRRKAISRRK